MAEDCMYCDEWRSDVSELLETIQEHEEQNAGLRRQIDRLIIGLVRIRDECGHRDPGIPCAPCMAIEVIGD